MIGKTNEETMIAGVMKRQIDKGSGEFSWSETNASTVPNIDNWQITQYAETRKHNMPCSLPSAHSRHR